jgi:hypothetical protein
VRQNPPLTELAQCWEEQHFRDRWQTLLSVDDIVDDLYSLLDELKITDKTFVIYSCVSPCPPMLPITVSVYMRPAIAHPCAHANAAAAELGPLPTDLIMGKLFSLTLVQLACYSSLCFQVF